MSDLAAYMKKLSPEFRKVAEMAAELQRTEVIEEINTSLWNFREHQSMKFKNTHAAITAAITEIEKLK